MDRSLRLAALASAAVPGLDPISVQEIVLGTEEDFDVAFIQDTQQRRWVIRAPRTEVAAARMDASLAMLDLLERRVPFSVPAAKGFSPIPNIGRAAVHHYIPGHPLDLAALHPGHPVTAELGRTIAMIHNVDRALYDEAGLPAYEAEDYRKRHLAEIDRGAATGRVPAGLLARWEEALDDVRLWRFAPTPVHGSLDGAALLVTFPDPKDSASARIRGVTGWEAAQVADPADDFAALVGRTRSDVVDAVLTAYRQVRVERPDEHLLARARLGSELAMLGELLAAVAARDEVATEALTARLRRLDDAVHDERQARRLRIVPAGPVPVATNDGGELAGFSRSTTTGFERPTSAAAADAEPGPARAGADTDAAETADLRQGDPDRRESGSPGSASGDSDGADVDGADSGETPAVQVSYDDTAGDDTAGDDTEDVADSDDGYSDDPGDPDDDADSDGSDPVEASGPRSGSDDVTDVIEVVTVDPDGVDQDGVDQDRVDPDSTPAASSD